MPERHLPVLVVGGSLVGLTTSVLLARYGVLPRRWTGHLILTWGK
jgi:2-polyprenyl-6-methoxyphenol hydroxylase-like FAD-dependent oxidoreductase